MKRWFQPIVGTMSLLQIIVIGLLIADHRERSRRLEHLERALAEAEIRVASGGAKTSSADSLAQVSSDSDVSALVEKVARLEAELADANLKLGHLLEEVNQARSEVGMDQGTLIDIGVNAEAQASYDLASELAQAKGRNWGPEQVSGPPDTEAHGDIVTAWASREPDAGEEWLELDYENAVSLAEVNVHESYHPGAISKVVAILPNGDEKVIWEGIMDSDGSSSERVESSFAARDAVRSNRIKVYLDTTRVSGWNEIDAVELVGSDGSRQWASKTRASSSYADR